MTGEHLVLGATGSLGVALARQLAAGGAALLLAGRNAPELEALAADVRLRNPGASVRTQLLDLAAPAQWPATLLSTAFHTVWMLAGDMGDGGRDDAWEIGHVITLNFTHPAMLLNTLAAAMAQAGGGRMVVVSSVAGERGRQSNYPYGSAKAGLTAFASGLRNRYARIGVHGGGVQVMTVKPGFIDTPMTYGMRSLLIAPREAVARRMIAAAERGQDVLYVPWFWRGIMAAIRAVPESVFKKLSL